MKDLQFEIDRHQQYLRGLDRTLKHLKTIGNIPFERVYQATVKQWEYLKEEEIYWVDPTLDIESTLMTFIWEYIAVDRAIKNGIQDIILNSCNWLNIYDVQEIIDANNSMAKAIRL